MLQLSFSGWVSCRLATNPDPFDDPRGTRSGFQQFAYAGEPDLDRIIRFRDPPFRRSHTPPIGVTVTAATREGTAVAAPELDGAIVELLDNPVFEGRNGVIATDAAEPIYPIHFSLARSGWSITRKLVPNDLSYPYTELMPIDAGAPADVGAPAEFGRIDHTAEWTRRTALLTAELAAAGENDKPGLGERLAVLGGARPNFRFAMHWRFQLNAGPVTAGTVPPVFATAIEASAQPWALDLWFGGWDKDAQSFFCVGTLALPEGPVTG
jgi:hypothetical protein